MKPTMTRGELRVIADTDHVQCGDAATMANMLLAEMDIKPVAWIVHARQGDMLTSDGDFVANAEGIGSIRSTPLYAAPPAPVDVPDELAGRLPEILRTGKANRWEIQALAKACRAAMPKAGPVKAATVPDGWKLVPVEPTEEMCKAGYEAQDKWRSEQCDNFKERRYSFSQPRYKAMIDAAPAAPDDDL